MRGAGYLKRIRPTTCGVRPRVIPISRSGIRRNDRPVEWMENDVGGGGAAAKGLPVFAVKSTADAAHAFRWVVRQWSSSRQEPTVGLGRARHKAAANALPRQLQLLARLAVPAAAAALAAAGEAAGNLAVGNRHYAARILPLAKHVALYVPSSPPPSLHTEHRAGVEKHMRKWPYRHATRKDFSSSTPGSCGDPENQCSAAADDVANDKLQVILSQQKKNRIELDSETIDLPNGLILTHPSALFWVYPMQGSSLPAAAGDYTEAHHALIGGASPMCLGRKHRLGRRAIASGIWTELLQPILQSADCLKVVNDCQGISPRILAEVVELKQRKGTCHLHQNSHAFHLALSRRVGPKNKTIHGLSAIESLPKLMDEPSSVECGPSSADSPFLFAPSSTGPTISSIFSSTLSKHLLPLGTARVSGGPDASDLSASQSVALLDIHVGVRLLDYQQFRPPSGTRFPEAVAARLLGDYAPSSFMSQSKSGQQPQQQWQFHQQERKEHIENSIDKNQFVFHPEKPLETATVVDLSRAALLLFLASATVTLTGDSSGGVVCRRSAALATRLCNLNNDLRRKAMPLLQTIAQQKDRHLREEVKKVPLLIYKPDSRRKV
eukprot:GHVT01058837.1.p1 GENE.GHVT01058837.1~~GHVT01058837.1.p1  ORF type:complete len:608 (-),score=65.78 GHVT01058837.1:2050-3873(-)